MALPKPVPPRKASAVPPRKGTNGSGPAPAGKRAQPVPRKSIPPNGNAIH